MNAGHSVHLAGNGAEALRAVESGPFDLVLLDLRMPEVDGFEATRRIRGHPDPRIATLPVVALTADVTQQAAIECRRSGINEVVAKPLSLEKLEGLLRTYSA